MWFLLLPVSSSCFLPVRFVLFLVVVSGRCFLVAVVVVMVVVVVAAVAAVAVAVIVPVKFFSCCRTVGTYSQVCLRMDSSAQSSNV